MFENWRMTRPAIAVLAAAVLGAFGLGLLLGRAIAPGGRDSVVSGPPAVAVDAGAGAPTQRRAFQEPRSENARRPAVEETDEFAYRRLSLDTSEDTPKACFQFTRALDDDGDINYADFVRLSPEEKPAVEVAGTSLCLTGLSFDKDYRATLRAGLPSAKGETLARSEEVVVAFGDKPAYVGFAGDGVILPRLEADGIGIETVNVEKVEITVRRVSDRSLARKEMVSGGSVGDDGYYYVYGDESGDDVGVVVWQDEIDTAGDPNETATTVFALGAALKDLKPGAYFVRARDVSPGADKRRTAQAWRWIMFTDMALTTYSSSEGVDVFVRSISTARPLVGVELALIAANNDVLGRATTNADGRARFDAAVINGDYPLTPRMIMAYGPQDDFAALDLSRAPLDLSDRNIGGRTAPANLDAYVYLDRGIYRPGETVHISGLLRGAAGKAVTNRPLTLTIKRPNLTDAEKIRIEKTEIGGFSLDYETPRSAPRGVWRIDVEADGAGRVGGETFSVEDFVPQRLEVKLETDEETPMRAGEKRPMTVASRFLYGAPASGLAVEAEARLRLDPNPFPDLKGYRFGPVNGRFDERFIRLPNTTTDAAGNAELSLSVDEAPKGYGAPMRADVVVGVVEPGGRVVRESARIPVRPDERYVGLKKAGDGYGFGRDELAEIDAALLDWRGAMQEGDLEWRLVEEDYWFDWYRDAGEWRWRRSYKDVLVAEGRTQAKKNAPARISQRLDYGTYRLSVWDPASKAKTDFRFYVGWRSYAAGADTPDQAALTAPDKKIAPGARARLRLEAPYAGEAIVTVATDRVHLVQRLKVERKGRDIIIDTDPAWGAGFYVLATVVTPRDAVDRPVPRRAMAVAYVPFDMSERTLKVSLNAPEVMQPRQKLELPVRIAGAKAGSEVMMTIAAVDEGILRLTKFEYPDPVDYYYGKKRLGVSVRDDYGRILHANLGAPARFGGDQIGGEGLTVVPTKSVALFSGLITVNADGRAVAPIEIPDFNGELRLMAVAWSAEKLGRTAQPLTVRDPVPAELALPRFLSPGDAAQATLLIDNVDGAPGDYAVAVNGERPIDLSQSQTFTLAKGEKKTHLFELAAGEVGIGKITLSVKGPDNFAVTRDYPIEVRTPYFPVSEARTVAQAPGESFALTKALTNAFVPGSAKVSVSFSRLKGVEPGPLLDALYRYPYGCSEQLTSSAFPLLFVDVLGGEVGRDPERAVRPRVQEAVNKLLNRQGGDGAFGLWREGDSGASAWLGPYLTDFLYRARQEGYGVPQEALERSYGALSEIARVDRWTAVNYQTRAYDGPGSTDKTAYLRRRAGAYAFYVLARAGRADLSDLRYFHDALLKETPSPLARAHIAAALFMMGDRSRAASAFDQAVEALGWENRTDYYQSPLRDIAGVLALAAEAGEDDRVPALTERLTTAMKDPNRMHTQEKAFTLLAAQALIRVAGPVAISVDGAAQENLAPAPSFHPDEAAIAAGRAYRNDGEGQIFRTVTVSGAPKEAPGPVAQGFTLSKRIATRDGRPVDLSAVRQNDRLVVVLTGAAANERLHPVIIADLLPAGFEIETVLRPEDGGGRGRSGPYKWIGEISYPKIAEARDDRFVAAIDVRKNRFTFAYIVRAVTPGDYVLPGGVVEDMYRPGVFARTASTSLSIAAAQ
ncbi:MAG: alpha-2-macroglobulin [Parvularculaceae bacterium]